MEIIFEGEPVEVGDQMITDKGRRGKVYRLNTSGQYPIVIQWEDESTDTYTADGRYKTNDPITLKRYDDKERRYVARLVGTDTLFITGYFKSANEAERVICDAEVICEVPNTKRNIQAGI